MRVVVDVVTTIESGVAVADPQHRSDFTILGELLPLRGYEHYCVGAREVPGPDLIEAAMDLM